MKHLKPLIFLIFLTIITSCSYSPKEVSQPAVEKYDEETTLKIVSNTEAPAPSYTPSQSASPSPTPFERKNAMNSPKIIIHKSERTLFVYDEEILCAKMQIALGFSPVGHKTIEGDGKTPEGEYYICSRNDNSKFYLSLGISYPNIEDARAGLDSGRITQKEYEEIKNAVLSGKRPPWNTALGGEIMIHGTSATSDWTAGCIAVKKENINYLWENCPIGTPVEILP